MNKVELNHDVLENLERTEARTAEYLRYIDATTIDFDMTEQNCMDYLEWTAYCASFDDEFPRYNSRGFVIAEDDHCEVILGCLPNASPHMWGIHAMT